MIELLPPPILTFVTTALLVLALFPPRDGMLRQRLAPYGSRRASELTH